MTYKKKSWTEKLLDSKSFPKVLAFERRFPCGKALEKWGAVEGDSVVLVAPFEVDEIMKQVPKGRLITIYEICDILAKKHKVKFCCSLTAGIFINIVAHAAEEVKEGGETSFTPYWRTLKTEGVLNPKFPGGFEKQKQMLEKEGFRVVRKGKKFSVDQYEKYLITDM
ncbi:MAG: MGMT family protein [Candidatus Thermoplasmatota archaeon]|nr:MGMT family protein [Candidatus Thermoplasmatota archaeon]MBU1941406.1 MGMT family protein [Candidatus Thermoplasmatota archaeon]